MTRFKLKGSGLAAAVLVANLIAGCASEAIGPSPTTPAEPGHAFLKIVGEKNVFMGLTESRDIVVKYVNDADQGLAGSVSFRIDGDAKGGSLSSNSQVTGPGGEVTISIIGGNEGAFRVVAEAQYATPVDWAVAVRKGGDTAPNPFNIVGTYRVESTFDLATGLPGTAGQMLRPAIDIAINTILKQLTTVSIDGTRISIVQKFAEFGGAFGDVAKKFGLKSQIQIYKDPNDPTKYLAKHTIDGVFFKIKNKRTDKTLAEMNMDNIVVDRIPVTVTGETSIAFGDHNLGLSYGKVIVFAMDNVLIPLVSQNQAYSLAEFLATFIDCQEIAGTGDLSSLYESLCDTAIVFAGSFLEGKLTEVGGVASQFQIHGTVRPVDSDSNRTVDQLVGGEWEGVLKLGNDNATLAKPNQKFTGQRMGM